MDYFEDYQLIIRRFSSPNWCSLYAISGLNSVHLLQCIMSNYNVDYLNITDAESVSVK